MKLAIVQMPMSWTLAENVATITRHISFASERGANVVAFPELAVTGFHREIRRELESARCNGEWLRDISRVCASHHVGAFIGAPRFDGEAAPLNSYLYIGPNGELTHHYDKVGLTESETQAFRSGKDREPWSVSGIRFGITICREIVDEQPMLEHYAGKLDVLLWPAYMSIEPNIPPEEEQVNHAQAAKVAKQLDCTVLQVNWADALNSPDIENIGGSIALASSGETLAMAPLKQAGQMIIELPIVECCWAALPATATLG